MSSVTQYLAKVFAISFILFVTTSVCAFELDNQAVTSTFDYGFSPHTDSSIQGELELVPEIELALEERVSMVASARIRIDAFDELVPGKPSNHTYTAASRPLALGNAGTLELRDLYLEFRSRKGLTRLGKQQIAWGRLDGIKVLDLLNPQDFREFIMEELSDSRIGLWSAYFDYSLGNWRAELALIPDSSRHATPEGGAWFELTASRFQFGAKPGQQTPPITTIKPDFALRDSTLGLRLSRQLGVLDFSAVAYWGKDPEPLGRIVISNEGTDVERYYEDRDAFGFSVDLSVGPAVLRAEYAYQPKRLFNSRFNDQLTAIALDQHRGAIGLDVHGPYGIFVNMQYLIDTITDAPEYLVRPASDRVGTLYLRRAFFYDTLAVEARLYHSLTDHDQLASLSIQYAASISTSLELSTQYFSGVSEGLFGQFTDRDRITLSLHHVF